MDENELLQEASSPSPVVLGRVVGAFGVKGWVKVHSFTEIPNTIVNYKRWLIGKKDRWRPYNLLSFSKQGQGFAAQLDGCVDRDSAEVLKGMDIAIDHADLPALQLGDYYWSELLGKTVVNTQGVEYGRVTQLMETGANDVLVVTPQAGPNKDDILIPYIDNVVVEVDLSNSLIRVDWEMDYL